MYTERSITNRLKKLLEHFPVVVISGARQVGKSTLLQNVFKEYEYVTFDPVIDIENARKDPELFLRNKEKPLILDEIQYSPEVIPIIKRYVDIHKTPGQFIITGSQQWEMLKGISESLAGRAVFLDLYPFSLQELSKNQQNTDSWLARWLNDPDNFFQYKNNRVESDTMLFQNIWTGFFPKAKQIPIQLVPDYYSAYIRTYVERDVRMMVEISNYNHFGTFIQLLAALSAQEINYSEIGRDIGITPQTAKRWIQVLSHTFLWYDIPAFSGNTIKRISNKPKGYLLDTGLICNLHSISTYSALGGHPLWGAIFETAVVIQLLKMISLMSPAPNIYHWRNHSGAEVDIILEYNGKYYPIEIKANSMPKKKDCSGIKSFNNTYSNLNIMHGLVIAPVDNIYPLSDTVHCIPWDLV